MSQNDGMMQRWQNFRPSKGVWLWSCAGAVAATMILGFTAGGWVTGGTASEMAAEAAEASTAELAALLCVNKFVSAPDARVRLTALQDTSSWERDDLIEEGGFAALSGGVEIVDGSIDLCADKLAAMEELPIVEPAATAASEPVATGG